MDQLSHCSFYWIRSVLPQQLIASTHFTDVTVSLTFHASWIHKTNLPETIQAFFADIFHQNCATKSICSNRMCFQTREYHHLLGWIEFNWTSVRSVTNLLQQKLDQLSRCNFPSVRSVYHQQFLAWTNFIDVNVSVLPLTNWTQSKYLPVISEQTRVLWSLGPFIHMHRSQWTCTDVYFSNVYFNSISL